MKIQVTACDHCRTEIKPGARRLTMSITLGIINGHEKSDSRDFFDLCSEQCAHEALTALTRSVEEIK